MFLHLSADRGRVLCKFPWLPLSKPSSACSNSLRSIVFRLVEDEKKQDDDDLLQIVLPTRAPTLFCIAKAGASSATRVPLAAGNALQLGVSGVSPSAPNPYECTIQNSLYRGS